MKEIPSELQFKIDVLGLEIWSSSLYNNDEANTIKGLDKSTGFEVYWKGATTRAAYFRLAPMPGCCGVVVSTDSRNTDGLVSSDLFHKVKEVVARKLGYSMMIATSQVKNIPQIVGALKYGNWKVMKTFRNSRTDNELYFLFKEIK